MLPESKQINSQGKPQNNDDDNVEEKNHEKSIKESLGKCIRGVKHSINIIQAVLMRVIFSLHSIVAIIFVYFVKQEEWYLVNLVGVVFLGIELFVTIIKRRGKEPRWFLKIFFLQFNFYLTDFL